jgi:hypothetical protein
VLMHDFGKAHAAELLAACATGRHHREAVRLFQLMVKGGVSVKGGELNTALLASFTAPAKLDPTSFALGCRVAVAAYTTNPALLDTELVRGLLYASPPSSLALLLSTSKRLGRTELGEEVAKKLLEHALKFPNTGDWLQMLHTAQRAEDLQVGVQGLRRLVETGFTPSLPIPLATSSLLPLRSPLMFYNPCLGACMSWTEHPANVATAVTAVLDGVKRTQAGAVLVYDALDICAHLLRLPKLPAGVSAAGALQAAEAVVALPSIADRRACLPSLVAVLEVQNTGTKEPMFCMLKSSHTLYSLLLEQGTWCAAAYLERRLQLTARRLAELSSLPELEREHVERHEVAALAAALPVLQQLGEKDAGGGADETVLRALMSMQLMHSMFNSGCWELVWSQFSAAQKRHLRTVLLPDLVRLPLAFYPRNTHPFLPEPPTHAMVPSRSSIRLRTEASSISP